MSNARGKVSRFNPRGYFEFSLITSVFLFLVVLSFREYFFFLPNFSRPQKLIALTQIFTTMGWILLIVAPPILLNKSQRLSRFNSLLFLLSALIWPISTLTIKVLNYYYFESMFLDYLGNHPVFLLFEYVVPAIYVYMWRNARKN
jgi:hypothetical protein